MIDGTSSWFAMACSVFARERCFIFRGSAPKHVAALFTVLFLVGTGRSFSGPASSALLPHLVPKGDFVNAVSWGASIFQLANFVGPALGGVLFTLPLAQWLPSPIGKHLAGGAIVYAFALATLFVFLFLLASLSVRPGRQEQRAISAETLLAGFRYMWHKKLLLGVTTLDLFAVLLGGAVALLPIFAENILHSGPSGLGILRAAPALGALCVSILMTWRPISHNAGVRMLFSVVIFGAATVVFGLSRNMALSLGRIVCCWGGRHGQHHCPLFDAAVGDAAGDARASECCECPVYWSQQRIWEF